MRRGRLMKSRPALLAIALATLVATLTCGGPTEPRSGVVTVSLTTANTGDGALLISVNGPGIDSITPAAGLQSFAGPAGIGSARKVLLIGDIKPGPIVNFRIPDRKAIADYSATVLEVARSDDLTQRSTTAYSLGVSVQ